MNIFLDESGSFVRASTRNSWNSIAAYVAPEVERRQMKEALTTLHHATGIQQTKEIKLRDMSETAYFDFLVHLSELHGVLFAVATDAGLNHTVDILKHRDEQAAKITNHIDGMRHKNGRRALRVLSDQVRNLAPQLYIQLQCQVILIAAVLRYGTLYFVQRFPKALGNFRWRIDQKNSTRTEYEKTFVTITPPLLQTISLREPLPMLEGADYSAFKRFDYPEGKAPTYLNTTYGVDIQSDGPALNIGKLIREDLEFVDSRENQGVQIADLLAAGLRRSLRAQFNDNRRAAQLLGSLMLQGVANGPPMRLLGFSEEEEFVNSKVADLIHTMGEHSRSMLAR